MPEPQSTQASKITGVMWTTALVFAQKSLAEKKRPNGEPAIDHALRVAETLAELGMDKEAIVAGLLHNTTEEGAATLPEIEKNFGNQVSRLVKLNGELRKLNYYGRERHAEGLRKFFIAISTDIRALVIRFVDRLDVLTTAKALPDAEQARIASETIEIYAPLANRLGMGIIKGRLEDSAFPYLYPKEYAEVKKLRHEKARTAEKSLEHVRRALDKHLAEENIRIISVDERVKHLWSLWQKMKRENLSIDEVYDILALRIIVPTIADCYSVLGIIHKLWPPVPGKIKDYIATPKPNGYQSLHTTVLSGDGGVVEIQIRTKEMHEEAERGIASHIGYDELDKPQEGSLMPKKLAWITKLIDRQKKLSLNEPETEDELFKDRIFVFTPKGDVIELPAEATVLDFAYAVHTQIGNAATGGKVNGKFVALDTKLLGGEVVEIVTRKSAKPSAKWLEFVKTNEAKKRIRTAIRR